MLYWHVKTYYISKDENLLSGINVEKQEGIIK